MPKGAHHHLHLTSAVKSEFMISLTYADNVYYSDWKGFGELKVFDSKPEDGFYKCNHLRLMSSFPFDELL